jgi:hypothetical protein
VIVGITVVTGIYVMLQASIFICVLILGITYGADNEVVLPAVDTDGISIL